MSGLMEGVLIWYGLTIYFSVLTTGIIWAEECKYYGTPKYIYNNSNLNWFGVIMLSFLIFILIPAYYIICFIYWICHVGRKIK